MGNLSLSWAVVFDWLDEQILKSGNGYVERIEMSDLPTIPFGPKGPLITRIGLGGEGILRTTGHDARARQVIHEAVLQHITYFDTAPAYQESQAYLGSVWAERPQVCDAIFQTSKSPSRTYAQAMSDLTNSLNTLHRDHLDLWQIHDLRTWEDIRQMEGPGGALEAFVQAREEGRVRHIGATGHHDPEILKYAVTHWPLDSVLLPANPAETLLGGFLDGVVDEARDREMTVIGMKCLGGGMFVQPENGITADILIRYALNCPVDLIIVGCSTPDQVRELVNAATDTTDALPRFRQLENAFRPHAPKLTYYRGRV